MSLIPTAGLSLLPVTPAFSSPLQLGQNQDLPDQLVADYEKDEDFLKKVHRVLLEVGSRAWIIIITKSQGAERSCDAAAEPKHRSDPLKCFISTKRRHLVVGADVSVTSGSLVAR